MSVGRWKMEGGRKSKQVLFIQRFIDIRRYYIVVSTLSYLVLIRTLDVGIWAPFPVGNLRLNRAQSEKAAALPVLLWFPRRPLPEPVVRASGG